jgi:hypothetical protein
LSIIGLASVFSSGKFDLAIVSEEKPRRRIALAWLAILTSFVAIFVYAQIYALLIFFNILKFEGSTLNMLLFCALGILLTVIHDSLVNLKISQKVVKPIAKAKIIRVAVASLFQLLCSFVGWLNIGLLMGEVAGRLSGAFSLLNFKQAKITSLRAVKKVKYLILVAKRNLAYPLKTAPSWAINNASTLLLPAFLGWQYDLTISGGFFLMYKIFSLPETAIVQSVNQSFMVEFKRYKGSLKKQLKVFQKTSKVLFRISICIYPFLGIAFFHGVGFVFGTEWESYAIFGVLMIPYFIAQFTMSSLYVSLNILGKHSSQLIWDIFRSGSLVLTCIITYYYDVEVLHFISFLSLFTCVAYCLLYMIIRSELSRPRD